MLRFMPLLSSLMITLRFRPGISKGHKRAFCYRLAGQNLVADLSVAGLGGFVKVCPEIPVQAGRMDAWTSPGEARLMYQGPSWIGNRPCQVSGYALPAGYQIAVTGIGVFWISEDGQEIVCIEEEASAGVDLLIEAATGPALILALALHGTWCLHASAVAFREQRIAFLGESGRGKSTLARWLGAQTEQGWRRLGDDILPVSLGDGRVDYLPHFPQPKLPASEQPSLGLSERLSLSVLYVLRRPSHGRSMAIRTLDRQEGILSLIRYTVASRLFDENLLAKHLDFCAQAGSQIPVREIIYPLSPHAMPEVQEALLDALQPQESSSAVTT